jgi:PIN domain nuclease of toxin-antitoxin system
LLDTHVWLWLVLGTANLSSTARSTIVRAASTGDLRIAAITLWEIALLAARNRITLGKPTIQWIEQAVTASFASVEPLTAQVAVESCELPDRFHRDPADRMIVATARVTGAVLMTQDRQILNYAARGHLTAVAA